MRRATAGLTLTLLLLSSSPALAWDPFGAEPNGDASPAREPDPAPLVAPPPGVYYVTDTYVADVVTSAGPVTTYTTATIHESTGSYARVLETVGTGVASAYDGRAFNGRRTLGDGRSVAGTYYENYALLDGEFVAVSIVFFQDDAEIARLLAGPPASPADSRPVPPAPVTSATSRTAIRNGPAAPTCCGAPAAVPTPGSTPRPPRPIRPGLSLLPVSAPLSTLEVLRGRLIGLWPRAFVDDREVPVLSWSLISGDAGEPVATTGPGGTPFRTSWARLAPPGGTYDLVFRLEIANPDDGHRFADTAIAVVVRSPALED